MNIKLKKIIHFLISLPISIWINFKVFPFRTAILLHIIIDYRTSIYGHGLQKGSIILPAKFNFGLIKIGWGNGSLGNPHNKRNYIIISGKGKLIFNGKTQFAMGVTLRSDNDGVIQFGQNFRANQNFTCFSNTEINFGDNVLIGWNVNIRDSDGHKILNANGEITNLNNSINIGNHVWISSYCDILKGSSIPDNCIVGFRALVTKRFNECNSIIAGSPARIIKQNIKWEV
ncbi:acyltransferase [Phocaeicola vulgatus]|uniref:acyltransferase n=1 Tax=Phocaeicola vulgatus TaxID=821 RepID=UPI000E4359C3|nr:acyltransferase [Phocaeicola vulgatus]RGM68374.1 acyltransferase [Phocaeicola vulgatus]RGM70942.1 acyltransferase [Phocaeicola vulgatus]